MNGYVSRKQNNTVGYLFQNAHGDVLSVYSDSQSKLAEYSYNAWGEVLDESQNGFYNNPLRYCGEYYDYESDMTYLRARYYDSSIKRFISEDPIKYGLNWYAYCGNNPVMFVDPRGLEDVYIFYGLEHGNNGGFDARAQAEANQWEENGFSVKLVPIRTESEFVDEWNGMYHDGKIVKVSLYFHSNPHNLIIDYTKDEYMTTNPEECTDSGKSATYIGNLKVKNISTICLYACNSAHQNHEDDSLAITFAKTQNVSTVYGWDGNMRWGIFNGKPQLANSQEYFESWIPENKKRKPNGLIKYLKVNDIIYKIISGKWDDR